LRCLSHRSAWKVLIYCFIYPCLFIVKYWFHLECCFNSLLLLLIQLTESVSDEIFIFFACSTFQLCLISFDTAFLHIVRACAKDTLLSSFARECYVFILMTLKTLFLLTPYVGPVLCVDDQVWLNVKNIHIKRFTHKLDWKNLEWFTIKTVLSSWAYELNLLNTMKIHSVFYVFKLLSVIINSFLSQVQSLSQFIEVNEDVDYEVEKILDFKHIQEEYIQYLVSWVEYNTPIWESVLNVNNCDLLLSIFHYMYSMKFKLKPQSHKAWPIEKRPIVTALLWRLNS